MKKRLTIAHYKEKLDWVSQINSGVEYVIYSKLDNDLKYNDIIEVNKNQYNLGNIGRESHTYIVHILKNYENLFDLEYFTQGNLDHFPDLLNEIHNNSTYEYKQFSNDPYKKYSINGYITEHMKKEGFETRQIWDLLFEYEPPSSVEIKPHAILRLTKDDILVHDKSIYEKLLNLFSDNKKDNVNAWNLEYFWPLLFSDIHKKNTI